MQMRTERPGSPQIVILEGAAPRTVARLVEAAEMAEARLTEAVDGHADGLSSTVIVADPAQLSEQAREALQDALSGSGLRPTLVLTRGDTAASGNLAEAAGAVAATADETALAGLIGTVARWHGRLAEEFSAPVPEATPLVRRLSILVADDNSLNRQVVSRMFMIDGHEAVLAETGDEALEHLLDGAVDVAFLDVNMPGMSGIEVAQSYRTGLASAATIPMLALTADISQETRAACMKAGMVDVLVKPVGLEQLREALARHVLGADDERAAPSEAAEEPAANYERIDSLRELFGVEGFEKHFLGSFERDLKSSLDKTASAVGQHSPQAVREALHGIKSSASTAGARRIIELVDRYQKAGAPVNELAAFQERIEAEFRDYRAAARTLGTENAEAPYTRPAPRKLGKAS